MIKISLLTVVILILSSINGYGQDTLRIDYQEFGNQNHCAVHEVRLQPGYQYTPTGTEKMLAYTSSSCINYIQHKYAKLSDKLDGHYYIFPGNHIYFKYEEKYRDGDLDFKIYEYQDQVLISSATMTISKSYGINWISIGICSIQHKVNHYFTLEVIDENGRKEFLRFTSNSTFWCDPNGGGGGQGGGSQ